MKTKLSAVAMSTALITGLVISGPAAKAEVISEEVVSTPAESSTSADAQTEPVVSQSPVADVIESEESNLPGESSAAPDDSYAAQESEPTVTESAASADPDAASEHTAEVSKSAKATDEASEAQVEDSNEAPASEPVSEVTEPAPDQVQEESESVNPELKSVPTVLPESPKQSSKSFGLVSSDDRWDEINALLPEGSEDWSDEQWEVFAETEAGEEYFRQLNELLEEEDPVEDDFELSEEEQAFWDSILDTLPQDSLEWDDTQWEEYFRSDAGLEFIEQLLPIIADSIETDEDAADLQAFLEEVFADDPELRAYYLEMYLGITPETTGGSTGGSETVDEPDVSESEQPVADAEIKPAGSIGKTIVTKAQKASKSTEPEADVEASVPALANTGFDGFWAAGVGILLAIGGVVFIARSRKASTN
ncbi:hypothetical protein ACR9WD_03410 [Glutamicibacter sp. PAEs-4]|uniref:hypothetical protein n=1 Tax=Glutamicibacter sp. PAEs-4 TaxID=3444114 RepID=UPI003EBB1194